jgi:hypothetical protein
MSLMPKHPPRRRLLGWAAAALLVLATAGVSVATSPATGQTLPPAPLALPTPLRLASHLDLECFKTDPYQLPVTSVFTRHINPVLTDLPSETVIVGAREQLCVPVAKNNVLPPADVLPFIQYVDLSCYRIQGGTVNRTLSLRHLNPQLSTLPAKTVTITTPQQLCVPVVKNGAYPPAEVKALISYIDLKCYLAQPQTVMNKTLTLSHLNPVLTNLERHNATVTYNRQLCVPVQKNNEPIPTEVFNIVRYLDLEKYDIATPALPAPLTLTLNHLNPSLSGLPAEKATIQYGTQLALPVAKNGVIPPG